MQTTRTTQGVIVALFLAIAIEGPVQALLDTREEGRPQVLDLFTQAPSQDALRAFERTLEDRSWSANAVRAPFQGLRHALLGDLGAKVVPGREGWLFYRQGVDYLVQSWPGVGEGSPDDPLPAIVDFRDQLAARGVELLIAIAPGKASVYPEQLGARPVNPPVYAHTRAFQGGWRGRYRIRGPSRRARARRSGGSSALSHARHTGPRKARGARRKPSRIASRRKDGHPGGRCLCLSRPDR